MHVPTGTNRSIGLIVFRRRTTEVGRRMKQTRRTQRQAPLEDTLLLRPPLSVRCPLVFAWPGGHGEGQDTRSHPELGRENPQRRWYCVLRRGRVGRRQAWQGSGITPGSHKTHSQYSLPL